MKTTFTISRDRNGNKTVKIKAGSTRAFSIQTLGNLPETHRRGVCNETQGEVSAWVRKFGTASQKSALGL